MCAHRGCEFRIHFNWFNVNKVGHPSKPTGERREENVALIPQNEVLRKVHLSGSRWKQWQKYHSLLPSSQGTNFLDEVFQFSFFTHAMRQASLQEIHHYATIQTTPDAGSALGKLKELIGRMSCAQAACKVLITFMCPFLSLPFAFELLQRCFLHIQLLKRSSTFYV